MIRVCSSVMCPWHGGALCGVSLAWGVGCEVRAMTNQGLGSMKNLVAHTDTEVGVNVCARMKGLGFRV